MLNFSPILIESPSLSYRLDFSQNSIANKRRFRFQSQEFPLPKTIIRIHIAVASKFKKTMSNQKSINEPIRRIVITAKKSGVFPSNKLFTTINKTPIIKTQLPTVSPIFSERPTYIASQGPPQDSTRSSY